MASEPSDQNLDNDAPPLSVVMPMHNARKYVAQTVRSILAQRFSDFEFLVIDDGSTDGSATEVEQAVGGDQRVKIITQANAGVSAASNHGTRLARGEFLARVDADDICLPDRFAKQIAFLREHPDVVAVGSRVMFVDPDGLELFEMPGLKLSHEEIDEGLLNVEWTILQPATMFRTSALKAVGGYRTDLRIHEDHDLFLKLAEIGRLANLPEILFQYRQHSISAVSTYAREHVSALESVYQHAWKRRGLTGVRPIPAIAPHPADAEKNLKRDRLWGWMSLKSRHLEAARKYARRGLRRAPFSADSWKLMYCALRGY
jgi:glycosyltransferase involved in cell wall biosynthesis